MSRKLLITIIILLAITAGFSVWFFFFNSSPVPTIPPTNIGSPFGEGGENVQVGDGLDTTTPNTPVGVDSTGKPISKFFKISDRPTAGVVAFNNKSKVLVVRFVDRATGHIIDADPTTLEKTKISNNTYPKIQEAYFKSDGSAVLLRSLKNDSDVIENISLALTAPQSITATSGTPPTAVATTDALYSVRATNLVGNMGDVAVGPTNSLVYFLKDNNSIATSLFDGTRGTNLFSSSFSDWRISWPSTNIINITTKASVGVSGFSYNLNATNGALTKILGPLNALTAVESSDGKNVAYSYVSGGKTVFAYKNLVDKREDEILPATFADKCLWSKKNVGTLYCGTPSGDIGPNEPNSWYQGSTHFSDEIWRFNMLTYTSEVLVEPKKDFGAEVDLINPVLSPNEDYLFFINKNDLHLWALKLE